MKIHVRSLPAAAASLLILASGGAGAQSLKLAADGHPDLQGIWQARNTAAYGLEAHSAAKGILAGPSVIVDPPDGKIPYKLGMAAKRMENFKKRASADPLAKCFLPGVPRIMYLHYPFQIFQTPQYVIMAFEFVHATRTIYLDGAKHPDDIDFWLGDSRGRWEGNTLVVDVGDNNGMTWLDSAGDFSSNALHVVERFTRTSPETLQYQATIEDPKVFTRPWTIRMPLYRNPDPNAQLYEYECSEYRAVPAQNHAQGRK
ncbi:MAG TPA: hypothetical protein VFW83_01190 [Bryobacteraceae bacterium]|nr:hypothetical protein [Bryobacteraceae bacterium]